MKIKYKYRIITGVGSCGDETFIVQSRQFWWPVWKEVSRHFDENWAIRSMETEKKRDTHKSRIIRLG